ncbi:sensor histidine kinase [Plantactinospora soyae]|uniref:histidine kinase n=1 Tax=Plantactinospora soyae TaxID=1544732 RepID=A0A927M4K1_9ACTN|nr:sensor histidine kinase [Plantactinospora soyae]MBE1487594.1 signal transduction histidine kinase [Plantactinospora soyae]
MGFRSSSLRTKVVALLATLTALWAFGAWITLRDGFNLLWVQTLESQIYAPTETLVQNLQVERRLSLAHLGSPTAPSRTTLDSVRQQAQADAQAFGKATRGRWARIAGSDELERRIAQTLTALDGLATVREQVDARRIDRPAAAEAFTESIRQIFRIYDVLGALDRGPIDRYASTLISLNLVRELIAQEDALLAGAFAAGRLGPSDHAQFVQLVGARRLIAASAAADLPEADRISYDQAVQQGANSRLLTVEDQLVLGARPGGRPPVSAEDWRRVADPASEELFRIAFRGGEAVLDEAIPVAIWTLVRLLVAVGLGLIAVIISVNTARAMVRQLERLRQAALTLANVRLPDLIDRLGRGERVDIESEAPPLAAGRDEIGQVAQAFNAAQETALRTAVKQAELRRSVRDIFLSLARRTQALLHRQLTLLDTLERRQSDPKELEDLFRVDHLATRMRRNAENLIVLSGSTAGRAWRRNVPMVDVLRGAAAEVEDYTRVTVLPVGPVDLAGRAVGDVIHLLAELIENGLSFSPPHTGVQVSGQLVANGYAVEIEDRGLGMSPEDRANANDRIASEPEFTLSATAQLGLFVVSRLARRHSVRVQLKESPYGGTTAVVLIPLDLVTDRSLDDDEPSGGSTGQQLAISTVGGEARRPSGPDDPDGHLPRRGRIPEPRHGLPSVPFAEPLTRPGPPPAERNRGAIPAPRLGSTTGWAPPEVEPTPTPPPTPPEAGPRPPTGEKSRPTADGPARPTTASGRAQLTPSGLPVRVRQANLAPSLRDADPRTEPEPVGEEAPRSPEQIRRLMSSYQSGTRRGRSDAARQPEERTAPPPDTAGT